MKKLLIFSLISALIPCNYIYSYYVLQIENPAKGEKENVCWVYAANDTQTEQALCQKYLTRYRRMPGCLPNGIPVCNQVELKPAGVPECKNECPSS